MGAIATRRRSRKLSARSGLARSAGDKGGNRRRASGATLHPTMAGERSGTYNPPKAKPHGRRIAPGDPDALRGAERRCFMRASATLRSTTLNQWVPGSSPGSPTTQSPETRAIQAASRKAAFAAISSDFIKPLFSLC
jgi:hypothetical protein